jgi:hypothetical protein
MKQFKINDTLFLAEVPVNRPENQTGKQITANNHIWIFDRSGSMSGTLRGLVDDMKSKLVTLDPGDTLSIGWFSGEGERDFILKGMEINSKSHEKIGAILDKYASTVGTTCFSEILHQTDQVVKDLVVLNNLFSLVFFTDGHPVVRDYSREVREIASAIDKVKGKLTSVLLVGYGAYYNKELLADMASRFGGSLVHSSNLGEYSTSLTEFMVDARENGGRQLVTLPCQAFNGVVFSINNKTVVVYRPNEHNEIDFVMPRRGKSACYLLCRNPNITGTEVINDDKYEVSTERAIYAGALVATQKTKTDVALELLGALGDVALIDGVTNSFTNDEYGRVEAKIRQAVGSPSGRYVGGKDKNHLPKRDAYCLIDVVALLLGDAEMRFMPLSPNFKYNRIGLKTVPKGKVPEFRPEPNPSVTVDTLTWNDSMLNLSLTCKIPGKVPLDKTAGKFGFSNPFPTFRWRSYSIVKDGNPNVTDLPLLLSESTFDILKSEGVVEGYWKSGFPVTLHLDRVPVMNRAIADGKTSAKELIKKSIIELVEEYRVKALKSVKQDLQKSGAKIFGQHSVLTKEQTEYLAKFHIGRNGFQPPSEEADATDRYTAKEFMIKIKNFSTMPKVSDVLAKQQKIKEANGGGKVKLTPSEQLLAETLQWVEPIRGDITRVSAALASTEANLRGVRKEIQKTKFAVLLGKRWFDEFDSRDSAAMVVDGFDARMEVRNVEVPV